MGPLPLRETLWRWGPPLKEAGGATSCHPSKGGSPALAPAAPQKEKENMSSFYGALLALLGLCLAASLVGPTGWTWGGPFLIHLY